jgi:thioester reductase-like protein
MAPYSFRAYTTIDRRMAFAKPTQISFAEAATLPTVFLTAHYALVHLARMQPGEKILIHAGTGGVGQAAIQIARHLGLEIFATAGTPQKRQMLKDLGVAHAMNSRTLDFADEIMEITGGRGVDAVLNSLAGDFIPKSFSVLAPFGRFLEIGKVDVYNNTKIGLEPLRNNISYFVIDLAQHLERRPDYVAGLFAELVERFEAGDYRPLTYQQFPITGVVEAFRHMAQGKHVGKNVLSFEVDEIPIGPCREEGHLFRAEASYLITGGASGFGLELAKWMARQGARHLVLMSRSGARDEQAAADIERLRAEGINVVDARGDVTRRDDVERVVADIQRDLPPLAGVIHGAMVLDDEFLLELSDQRFNAVLHPKVLGAWNLHLATLDQPLEHFLSFSSFSCVVGGPRQSNYNAGNYFLDQLAQHRRSLGLPALTFNWTAISGAGFVHRNEKTAQYLDKLGMKSISVDEALKVIQRTLSLDPVQTAVCRADWQSLSRLSQFVSRSNIFTELTAEQKKSGGSLGPRILASAPEEREALVEDFIAEQVASVFGVEAAQVDRETPLTRLGLDSLMAIDLMNRVESELAMSLPMGNMLSGSNVRDLAQTVLRLIAQSGETAASEDRAEAARPGVVPLKKLAIPLDEFPLSQAQREIWSRCRQSPGDASYQLTFAAKFAEPLDADRLRAAFAWLLRRHPLLAARIVERDDAAVQKTNADAAPEFRVLDAGQRSEEQLQALLAEHAQRPFDVNAGPLARLERFQTRGGAQVVLLTAHRLAADALSLAVLFDELIEAYFAPGLPRTESWEASRPFAYQDYAAWEREQLKGDAGQRAAAFWKEQLSGAPLHLHHHGSHSAMDYAAPSGAALEFHLDDERAQQALSFAAEQGVPLNVLLVSMLELLLHHYWRQGDLVVGCSVAGRAQRELRRCVGPFARVLPLRSRIDGPLTMLDLIRRNQPLPASAAEHQQFFSANVAPPEGANGDHRASPMPVTFVMEQSPGVDDRGLAAFLLGRSGRRVHFGGLAVESVSLPLETTPSDLALIVQEVDGEIFGAWRYDRVLFDAAQVARLHKAFLGLLAAAAAHPQQDVSGVNVFTKEERAALRSEGNGAAHAPTFPVIRPAEATSAVDFAQESRLDPAITAPANRAFDARKIDRVLLTGATGFLGAFLLNELLERTSAEVVCLVRAADAKRGLERIRENLAGYGLKPADFDARVLVVTGNLSQSQLGLDESQFDRLAEQIDAIYHNGADVNLGMPYEALRATNVVGTTEILRLACRRRLKPTHFVSTFTVLATDASRGRVVNEDDPLPNCEELLHGYSQTKWVAERLIAEARSRGLPVSIYRPGHITGHSRTGASNTGDLLHSILLACWRLGSIPSRGGDLDMTPVDYVSEGIVELSLRAECLGGVFHLTNPHPLKHQELLDFVERQQLGVRVTPYDQWRERLVGLTAQAPIEEARLLIGTMVPDEQPSDDGAPPALHPQYDCKLAKSVLAEAGIVCAPCNEQLLATYLAYTQRIGVLPEETSRQAVRAK